VCLASSPSREPVASDAAALSCVQRTPVPAHAPAPPTAALTPATQTNPPPHDTRVVPPAPSHPVDRGATEAATAHSPQYPSSFHLTQPHSLAAPDFAPSQEASNSMRPKPIHQPNRPLAAVPGAQSADVRMWEAPESPSPSATPCAAPAVSRNAHPHPNTAATNSTKPQRTGGRLSKVRRVSADAAPALPTPPANPPLPPVGAAAQPTSSSGWASSHTATPQRYVQAFPR
jgi:hypothetical protein